MEIFGERVDYLIPAAAACVLVFLFYGTTAALLSAGSIFMISKLKPLQRDGLNERNLAVLGAGVVLTFSVFYRTIFYSAYCSSAVWAVYGDLSRFMSGTEMPCFIRGGYLQYALSDGFKGVVRDIIMPIAGLGILIAGLPKARWTKLAGLGVTFSLLLGLWLNSPLFAKAEKQSTSAAEERITPKPIQSLLSMQSTQKVDEIASPDRGVVAPSIARAMPLPTAAPDRIQSHSTRGELLIPARFVGDWAPKGDLCKTPDAISITANGYDDYDSHAELTRVISSSGSKFEGEFLWGGENDGEIAKMSFRFEGRSLLINGYSWSPCD